MSAEMGILYVYDGLAAQLGQSLQGQLSWTSPCRRVLPQGSKIAPCNAEWHRQDNEEEEFRPSEVS